MGDSVAGIPETSSPETSSPETSSQQLDNVAMLAALLFLTAALVCGRVVQWYKIKWIGEAGVGLLIGLTVGIIMHLAKVREDLASRLSFKASVFLLVFMPSIMFHAGFTLDAAPFARNIGSIFMTAFLGTTISTFVIGYMMWGAGQLGWCYEMPLLYNLTFGAIISATDPVAVLAVFENLHANKSLYINVFGESVLNDAVAMVLYNTVSRFLEVKITTGEVFKGIGIFVGIFGGSVLMGVAVGLAASLIFKTGFFNATTKGAAPPAAAEDEKTKLLAASDPGSQASLNHVEEGPAAERAAGPEAEPPPEDPPIDEQAACFETALALVLAYVSYMLASATYLSGITAIISTAMMMNAYTRPNISQASNLRVSIVSKTLAITFELFSFVYIGLSVLQAQDYTIIRYTILCLVALAVSRACNIFPLCAIVNFLRPPALRIPRRHQFMMWWSGLRGPMAFALALDASEKYGEHGKVMKTCTLYLILITVLINGGLSAHIMKTLKLRIEDEEEVQVQVQVQVQAYQDLEHSALSSGPPSPGHLPLALLRERSSGLRSGSLPSIAEDGHGPQLSAGAGSTGGEDSVQREATFNTLGPASVGPHSGVMTDHLDYASSLDLRSTQSLGSAATSPSQGARHTRILEGIRDFNSGRLVGRFNSMDKAMSRFLVGSPSPSPTGSKGAGDAGLSLSPLASVDLAPGHGDTPKTS